MIALSPVPSPTAVGEGGHYKPPSPFAKGEGLGERVQWEDQIELGDVLEIYSKEFRKRA